MALRPYQEAALHDVGQHFNAGTRSVCLVMPTGAGKTRTGVSWLTGDSGIQNAPRRHSDPGLWVVHRLELMEQAVEQLSRILPGEVALIRGGTNTGALLDRPPRAYVSTIQTLLASGERPDVRRIILDECFPAGTMIDGRPIEDVRVGDMVSCWDHQTNTPTRARVTATFCKQPQSLVSVHLTSGATLTCTAEHPIFTRRGYLPAEALTADDEVLDGADLHSVRLEVSPPPSQLEEHDPALREQRLSRSVERSAPQDADDAMLGVRNPRDGRGADGAGESQARSGLLLGGAPRREVATTPRAERRAHEPQAGIRADADAESDARPGGSREGVGQAAGDRASTDGARRERSGPDGTAAAAPVTPRSGVDRGTPSPRTAAPNDATELRQDRHREPVGDDCDRGGRTVTLRDEGARGGRAEDRLPDWTRVDRVEVHERRGDDGFGELCPGDRVFNLEVEHHHNYFADGILVHNCHHFAADDWRTLLSCYPDARVLGLTATPERGDGRPLGDIFQELVVGARYPDLVADGHLVRCRAFAPPEAVDRGVANDPVAMYLKHGEGAQGFLFSGTIASADEWAQRFTDAGIRAAAVHQRMSARVRRQTLDDFRTGRIRILTNVYVLTEGVDVPAARVCILARAVPHLGNYLQMAGRVLRPAPDKPDAILIDLCGSVLEHGLPTEDREYALDGRAIRRTTASVRQCPQCGAVHDGAPAECDLCGYVFPTPEQSAPPPPRIYDMELREVYAGGATPEAARWREFERLVQVATARDYSLSWVVKQYATLFHEPPTQWLAGLSEETRQREYTKLATLGRERGYKSGFAACRYKEMFGAWPPWSWRNAVPAAAPALEPTGTNDDVPF